MHTTLINLIMYGRGIIPGDKYSYSNKATQYPYMHVSRQTMT